MINYEHTVIHVPTEELSRKVQEYLFTLGYAWGSCRFKIKNTNILHGDRACLRAENKKAKKILFFGIKDSYIEKGYDVISAEEFLAKVHIGKIEVSNEGVYF